MFVITPTTQDEWKTTLTAEYGVTEQAASSLVDWIASTPEVMLARPQTQAELESAVNDVERAIDAVDLTTFGDIQDQQAAMQHLLEILRRDLELAEDSAGSPESATEPPDQESKPHSGTEEVESGQSDAPDPSDYFGSIGPQAHSYGGGNQPDGDKEPLTDLDREGIERLKLDFREVMEHEDPDEAAFETTFDEIAEEHDLDESELRAAHAELAAEYGLQ